MELPESQTKRFSPQPLPIPPSEKAEAKTGLIFGFGPAEITFSADFQMENGEIFHVLKEATGFVFGPFILGVQPLPD